MKNLKVNQQKHEKKLHTKKPIFILFITMMIAILCSNSVMAQTWSGFGWGHGYDRWTVNDDNSNHWSQLRLQVSNTHAWNMMNEGYLWWGYDNSGNHGNLGARKMILTTDGKFGIGDFVPLIDLAIGDSDTGFHQNGDGELGFYTNNVERVRIDEHGLVGIGTTNMPNNIGGANISAYKLYVKGGVLTEEVRVRTGWADYVFADDYKLLPIQEVESFIKENGHLPNVPSEKQVEAQGIELGDITRIQQEKIEELVLYIIEQQKQIDTLKQSVDILMKKK